MILYFQSLEETHATTEVAKDYKDGHAKTGLFQDTATFVLIPFLIVLAIAWRAGAFKTVANALDNRATEARDELDAAQKMREEAAELLASYQKRQREAEEEAEAIIKMAKEDAKRLAAEMRAKLEEQLSRKEKAVEDKIKRAEEQALAEIRNHAAEAAALAAGDLIRETTTADAQSRLIDEALKDVGSRLN